MEKKAENYITDGGLQLGLVADANYPRLDKARVGLVVTDANSPGFRWEQRGDVFYSDDTKWRPVGGEVSFLPLRLCRSYWIANRLLSPSSWHFHVSLLAVFSPLQALFANLTPILQAAEFHDFRTKSLEPHSVPLDTSTLPRDLK